MAKQEMMRAAVFRGIGDVAVEDRPRPSIQNDKDVILKVSAAALCGSDLHWYRGHQKIPTGFIPGHEFVGTVEEMGQEVKKFQRGDMVVVCLVFLGETSRNASLQFETDQSQGNLFHTVRRVFLLPERANQPMFEKLLVR